MERFQPVLLNVWREAGRHIEIRESAANIAKLLVEHLPLAYLLVRRMDGMHSALETITVGQVDSSPLPPMAKTLLPSARWKRLMAWGREGTVLHGPSGAKGGDLATIVPADVEGEVLAGPLQGPDKPAGVLVLVAAAKKSFRPVHIQMVEALLDPFSAALENDRRLAELAALREAAEADRRSLLTRLGRQEIAETIVGADSGLRHVMERVELVAQSDVPILILGETGTGKEVVSRAIHTRSARSSAPFIRVNCGAIPAELIDSQLFGHEKGSFTGAVDTRQGWFERADGGTLFLDEIGELPLAAQVRLLRVLQDGFIERVGGQQPIRVDVRIVAATHRDLAGMVTSGTFREDLWYRVNVFPILLPRLRERIEDIPALARHFAQRAANRFGLPPVEPTTADLHLLVNYPWPGNIRELGAVIDRAAILGNGERLDVALALGGANAAIRPAVPPPTGPTLYEV
ncbi:MAG TPA: sigma-54 dependent transcriptional regulator, partial [Pirellulaceae bacterium]|nr:sigma-54 dependent transcriptional regulator [Pirellulaceae bacterium]